MALFTHVFNGTENNNIDPAIWGDADTNIGEYLQYDATGQVKPNNGTNTPRSAYILPSVFPVGNTYEVEVTVTDYDAASEFGPSVQVEPGAISSSYQFACDVENSQWFIRAKLGGAGHIVDGVTVPFSSVAVPSTPFTMTLSVEYGTQHVMNAYVNGTKIIDSVDDGYANSGFYPGLYIASGAQSRISTIKISDVIGGTSVADTTDPTVSSVQVNGTTLSIILDENISLGADGISGLTLNGSVTGAFTLSAPTVTTNTITANISPAAVDTDVITYAFTAPADGIQDTAGNLLANIASSSATNNTPAPGVGVFDITVNTGPDDALEVYDGAFSFKIWDDTFANLLVDSTAISNGIGATSISHSSLDPATDYQVAVSIDNTFWITLQQTTN